MFSSFQKDEKMKKMKEGKDLEEEHCDGNEIV